MDNSNTKEVTDYTSLRDIMIGEPPTRTATIANKWSDPTVLKEPLVRQAAVAYLKPMPAPESEPAVKGLFGSFRSRTHNDAEQDAGCWVRFGDVVLDLSNRIFRCGIQDQHEDELREEKLQ